MHRRGAPATRPVSSVACRGAEPGGGATQAHTLKARTNEVARISKSLKAERPCLFRRALSPFTRAWSHGGHFGGGRSTGEKSDDRRRRDRWLDDRRDPLAL